MKPLCFYCPCSWIGVLNVYKCQFSQNYSIGVMYPQTKSHNFVLDSKIHTEIQTTKEIQEAAASAITAM